MAHVYGHCDFFKNNYWFSQTNRKMMDQMANHGNRIRRYMDRFGVEEVEDFIDACLSIEDLIDIALAVHQAARPAAAAAAGHWTTRGRRSRCATGQVPGQRLHGPLRQSAPGHGRPKPTEQKDRQQKESRFPDRAERDVMLFVLEHAPLKNWQLDVLSIVRDEAYYFAPQGQTKIMNEGWASYWHSTIMTRKRLTAADWSATATTTRARWPRSPAG